ncbi:conserved protein of unknown function [uncultured Mediterranean phage uvMED]|nr:conserved protein of unknown function [uncultured Mediterranean phage uvMED]|tara:strand:+ start:3491 stop:3883 length:393 start_codon:yes stop_codon:yes gene_type:complete
MIGTILSAVSPIVDKFVEDKDQKNKLKAELEQSIISLDLAQAQANIEQAKHSSIFVAGARPAIMWICALGLMFHFILFPIAEWIITIWFPDLFLPSLDTEQILGLTISLLGLGGMRSWEKSKGIARENMK